MNETSFPLSGFMLESGRPRGASLARRSEEGAGAGTGDPGFFLEPVDISSDLSLKPQTLSPYNGETES